jgi:single-stranded DNA-specific DHH superfamily exonuclease
MRRFDVFNGDADGICALLQLRQHTPRSATLITGVKRDISLLDRVAAAAGDFVTVLDVAVEKNQPALDQLLALGAEVFYVDHHNSGELPSAPGLELLVNTAPEVCTSALVNGYLSGAGASWAVVGCFGDNLDGTAERIAQTLAITPDLKLWRELGILINYNAYGAEVSDLHFDPESLYLRLLPFGNPDVCMAEDPDLYMTLQSGYREDMSRAEAADLLINEDAVKVITLPDEPWARRVSGVLGNKLALDAPHRAHAVMTEIPEGFLVSVRAPVKNRIGADTVCKQFPTGGGRAAAAGINQLPQETLADFIDALRYQYK